MANFFRTLDTSIKDCSSSGDVASLAILERLKMYLSTGNFSSYSRAKELISVNGLSWKEASYVLKIKPDTVKRARYVLSEEVWNIVGKDFFDRLKEGDLAYCDSIVESLHVEEIVSPIPLDVSKLIRSLASEEDLNSIGSVTELSAYSKELDFLVGVSEPMVRAKVSNLDIGRLLALLGILDGSLGNPHIRVAINEHILGKAGDLL